ncbi:hypothetical protein BDW71DRAFT_206058 [Aspergillus fruticulosus]
MTHYDLNVWVFLNIAYPMTSYSWRFGKTGEWEPIKGKTYIPEHAELARGSYLQEATFGSKNVIATGIYGKDSKITFTVDGRGTDQWVSFYHQSRPSRIPFHYSKPKRHFGHS